MTKYESNPDDPMSKFTKPHAKNSVKDAKSTIARVKEALLKGKKILNIANILDAEFLSPWYLFLIDIPLISICRG